MRDAIVGRIEEIERRENVKIILAVESGSRAWGFASPDSDYDVRFIYVRTLDDYLKLERVRDVIETPIDAVFDVNGWDLRKALQLLYASNSTIFEWFAAPIVYRDSPQADVLRDVAPQFFSPEKTLYHYLHTAQNNFDHYLKGDKVRAKKYFYMLRPILACQWIVHRGTPVPVPVAELVDAELPKELRSNVDRLLEIKARSDEATEIPHIESIERYMTSVADEIKTRLAQCESSPNASWAPLDATFLKILNDVWK